MDKYYNTDNFVNSIKDYEILGFKLNIVDFNQTNLSYTILITLLPNSPPPKKVAFYSLKYTRQQWAMESEMSSQQ